jgi:hypothetical protein
MTTTGLTAADFQPEVLQMFDQYAHGDLKPPRFHRPGRQAALPGVRQAAPRYWQP